jgi:hypothetical protein
VAFASRIANGHFRPAVTEASPEGAKVVRTQRDIAAAVFAVKREDINACGEGDDCAARSRKAHGTNQGLALQLALIERQALEIPPLFTCEADLVRWGGQRFRCESPRHAPSHSNGIDQARPAGERDASEHRPPALKAKVERVTPSRS